MEIAAAGGEFPSGQAAPVDETDLVTSCFDDATLRALVGMRAAVRLADASTHLYLKWALLAALRDCSNKQVGWPHQRPGRARLPLVADPKQAFLRRVQWMIEDLESWRPDGRARVDRGDSRLASSWSTALQGELAACCITSPPYLNNFDYGDATRLELYFWGDGRSWSDLRQLTHSAMLASSTQQTTKGGAATDARVLATLAPLTSDRLAPLTALLSIQRRARRRGKEFDQLVPMYFAGMASVLELTKRHTTEGGCVTLVLGDSAPYGVHIDTPALVTGLAMELGFSYQHTEVLRQRGLRWVTNGARHSVPLSESLVVLRAPGPTQGYRDR